jgi:hypothetical protein
MKACSKCQVIKPFDAFNRNRHKAFGRDTECRQCKQLRRLASRTHKVCTACEKRKEIAEFYKNRERRDGYDNRCKSCCKTRSVTVLDHKATVRRQSLFHTPLKRKPKGTKRWHLIWDAAEREAARIDYEKLLEPPPVLASDGTRLDA